jgi:hypothetical protein
VIAIPASQEVIGGAMLLPPCLLYLLLELWIVFSFFFFLGLSLHVEQVIWIRIITLTTPHLPAWCIFSDTPEEICTKDPSSPIPFSPTLGAVTFPGVTFLVWT